MSNTLKSPTLQVKRQPFSTFLQAVPGLKIAAILYTAAAQPPAGWVMVPVEPTPEMVTAVYNSVRPGTMLEIAHTVWRAMLEAAPKVPPMSNELGELIGSFDAAMAEGLYEALAETTDERLRDLVERRLLAGYQIAVGPSLATAPTTQAAPPPAAQQRAKLWKLIYDYAAECDTSCSTRSAAEDAADIAKAHAAVDTMLDAMFAAQPQEEAPVAQGDESEREAFEAWIKKDCGDLSTFGSGQNIHYRNSAVNNAWTGWKARAGAAPVAQGDAEAELAYQAACSLAKSLFKKHFAHQPEYASGEMKWDVCDTTAGVISQIDNMVCGFALEDAEDAARYRWLRSGVRERQGIPVSGHRTISSGSLRALMEFNFWCAPDELDAAIDAARSQAKEGGAA